MLLSVLAVGRGRVALAQIAPRALATEWRAGFRTACSTRDAGYEVVHVDELFGVRASLDFVFHPVERVEDALRGAGLGEVESIVRDAYPRSIPPAARTSLRESRPRTPDPAGLRGNGGS